MFCNTCVMFSQSSVTDVLCLVRIYPYISILSHLSIFPFYSYISVYLILKVSIVVLFPQNFSSTVVLYLVKICLYTSFLSHLSISPIYMYFSVYLIRKVLILGLRELWINLLILFNLSYSSGQLCSE